MFKKNEKKIKFSDERVNSEVHKNSFNVLIVLFFLLLVNIFISIIFTRNFYQCVSSAIILVIASLYFTFLNLKSDIFKDIASIQINYSPKIIALKSSITISALNLIFNILYNILKIDKPLSYKNILINFCMTFIVFYFLIYYFIKLGSNSKDN